MPFFTVAVTTFNRADLVLHALESVLKQTFADYEFLIVDDASPDHTTQVAQDFIQKAQEQKPHIKFSYHRLPTNSGINAVRNEVVQQANGQFIVYVDDDDQIATDYLAQVYAALKNVPDSVGFAIPGHHIYWRTEAGDAVLHAENTYDCTGPTFFTGQQYIKRACGGASGLIVRYTAAQSNGEWNRDFRTGGDIDYMLRLAEKWDWMIIPNALLRIYNMDRPQLTQSRLQTGKTYEKLGDLHADKFAPFPITHQGYYFNAARMYYSAKSYNDGLRTLFKAIKLRPYSYRAWKIFIKLQLGAFFPQIFPNFLTHDRHGKK